MANDRVRILGVGYLGLNGDDLDAWSDFATDILAMEEVDATQDIRRFKMDVRRRRLTVHRGVPGLAYIGWEVQDARALETVTRELESAGFAVKAGGADEAQEREVAGIVACDDPAGNRLEFFYGAATQEVKRLESRYGARFVTGDQGMGHFVLGSSRYSETIDFYTRVLNFGVSDVLVGPLAAAFLGCNPRHHSIALLDTQGGADMFHHFMVEVEELNMVGQAYDRVLDRNIPLVMTLGRHWNDHMTSFYVQSPSGFAVEYGWGGRRVDRSTWSTVRGTGEISFWGHRPMTDALASAVGAEVGTKP